MSKEPKEVVQERAGTLKRQKEQFIPLRKSDIINLLCEDGKLNSDDKEKFKDFCTILESIYHRQYYYKLNELKEYYFPFDPDIDIIKIKDYSEEEIEAHAKEFYRKLKEVLVNANYEKVSDEEMEQALRTQSLFNVSLIVDFEDFKEYVLYKRGESVKEVEVKKLFGLIKKKITMDVYDRVVIYLRFKDEDYFVDKALGKHQLKSGNAFISFIRKIKSIFRTKKREKILKKLDVVPNSTTLKIFKNIPKADIEMLFPNTRIFMNVKDIALIGVPALIGTIVTFVTKFIASIGVLIGLVFVFLATKDWNQNELMSLLQSAVRGFAAIGAFGGYIVRQYGKYKNKKMNFMKELSENLYFRNLDNNKGVFTKLIDSAEEQEFKEAVLSYYFLYTQDQPLTENEVDKKVEEWVYDKSGMDIDFEISDALRKLNELELTKKIVNESDNNDAEIKYSVTSIDSTLKKLDYLWDNYFDYNK